MPSVQLASSNSSGLKSVFGKLCFHGRLERNVDLAAETLKLRFQIFLAYWVWTIPKSEISEGHQDLLQWKKWFKQYLFQSGVWYSITTDMQFIQVFIQLLKQILEAPFPGHLSG